MFPYIDIGPVHLGTFGLLLWLAAVAATVVLHKNFVRNGVDADALSVVALVVIAGVIGAKTWHELQNIADLRYALKTMGAPGWKHPFDVVMEFLHWFQAGFAWFGGMLAGIAMLMWQGQLAKPEGLTGWKAAAADVGPGGSGGGDWLWRGADRMFDVGGWGLRDQHDACRGVCIWRRMRWCRRLRQPHWCSRRRCMSFYLRWRWVGCCGGWDGRQGRLVGSRGSIWR